MKKGYLFCVCSACFNIPLLCCIHEMFSTCLSMMILLCFHAAESLRMQLSLRRKAEVAMVTCESI